MVIMSFLLPKLSTKNEVDDAIKSTEELVLVLRFGRENDPVCMQHDNIVSRHNQEHKTKYLSKSGNV